MEEKVINQTSDEVEIDLSRLFSALLDKAWIISLVSVLCAVAVFAGTVFLVTPTYQSTAKFYVNNSSISSIGEAALESITSGDISASRGLVKTYIVILNTRETLNDVIDYAGVDRTYSQVKSMISAEAVDSTEVFEVVVTSTDPVEAEKIANAIGYILPNRIKDIIDGTSAKVVEAAVMASKPSAPNYTKNAIIGFLVGLVLSCAVIVIRELMDITIRTEEDIAQNCSLPILAAVPDMEAPAKGSSYGYKKSAYDRTNPKAGSRGELVGGNISFAAAEAYKLLRTKLLFSFVDDESRCRVIGMSSALTGEGKSLTAINLAYTASQLGKKVLLIDCDMRRPSMADKLPINKAPGLSDFLTGQGGADNLIQLCGIKDEERAFHAISSGRTPPNPMELLSSARMEKLVSKLRESYDYIILDLPPVCEVSDALVAAKLTDGMLLVVRQHHCDRIALNAAVRQFAFVETKLLGVVFNCTTEEGSHFGYRSRYYNRYHQQYGYGHQKSYYAAAAKRSKKAEK